MNHDYRVNIKYAGSEYQLDLTREAPGKPNTVTFGGNSYSLHMNSQNHQLTDLLLQQLQVPSDTIEEVVRNFTHIPQVEAVQITTICKTSDIALSRLRPSILSVDIAARKNAIETGIMSAIPLRPGVPISPVSIEQRMRELCVPGVGIAIINDGEIEWSCGYGELKDSNKLLQAASISKTAAALTVLSLIDQCKLASDKGLPSGLVDNAIITLDTKVNTLLDKTLWESINPFDSAAGNEMTIRHLLSHTAGTSVSGFNGYLNKEEITKEISEIENEISRLSSEPSTRLSELNQRLQKLREAQYTARSEGDLPTVDDILMGTKVNSEPVKIQEGKTPGEKYEYSGGGTTILQKIVMKVTGQSFEDAVQERVFVKLKMRDSTYHPDKSRVVCGYDSTASLIPGVHNRYPELAAAGLWTTPTDLAKMAISIERSLKGETGGILSQDLAQQMIVPQTKEENNGLGVFVDGAYFAHSGGNEGFTCCMIGSSDGRGAVIMTNSNSGDYLYTEIIARIAEVYNWSDRTENKIIHSSPPLSLEEMKAITESPLPDLSKWTARLGSYYFLSDGQEFIQTLSEKDGKIFIEGENMPLQELILLSDSIGRAGTDIIRFVNNGQEGPEVLSLWGADHTKAII